MKGHRNVWAGTALALLMAAEPMQAGAAVMLRPAPDRTASPGAGIILAQEQQPTEEELLRKKQREAEQQQQEAPAEEAPAEEAPAAEAPAEQAPPEPAPAPEPEAEQPQTEEPQAEEPAEAPAEQQPEAPAEPEAEQQNEAPADEPAAEEPASEAPAEEAQPEQAPSEQPPAEQPSGEAPNEPSSEEAAPEEQPAEERPEEAPAEQQPAVDEAPEAEEATPPDAGQPPVPEEAPVDQAPEGEEPAPPEEAPATEGEAATPKQPAPEASEEQPAEPAAEPTDQSAQPPDQAGETPLPENAAPVLDSQKRQPAEGEAPAEGEQQPAEAAQPAEPAEGEQAAQPAEPVGPPPESDQAAQQNFNIEIQPVIEEEGTRVERVPDFRERPRRPDVEIVREIGDRVVIEVDNHIIVESNDRERVTRGAREVYYEDLSNGRTREVVIRENGVRVVTVRNRYGDIVRRSRIAPDGREYILAYVDVDRYQEGDDWHDPAEDLPPMELTIPVTEYILDAERVEDPDRYYEFLDQPPVERVERLYSIEEVKRSARVRDKTRRIDLDTINFEFGSASIPESEIDSLEGVAAAIEKILEDNPAETFLIEGHTDAVGSEIANLALSDERAEAVAQALTNVFGIPPENLVTQGYGEQFLKVRTQERERENRRVAIRRITPLVAPVASAQ